MASQALGNEIQGEQDKREGRNSGSSSRDRRGPGGPKVLQCAPEYNVFLLPSKRTGSRIPGRFRESSLNLRSSQTDTQPWPKESVALAKEVVRLEFAGRPDQYDLYASRAETTTPFAKLSWFYSDWVSGPDSKAVQTKKQAASPIWVMNYQWGVIGHPLTGNMTEDRQEQKRPRITSVGKNMVHGQ